MSNTATMIPGESILTAALGKCRVIEGPKAPTPPTEEEIARAEAAMEREWTRLHGGTLPPGQKRKR